MNAQSKITADVFTQADALSDADKVRLICMLLEGRFDDDRVVDALLPVSEAMSASVYAYALDVAGYRKPLRLPMKAACKLVECV